MGNQKNHLIDEHPKHMFKLTCKKLIAILCSKILLNWPYEIGLLPRNIFSHFTVSFSRKTEMSVLLNNELPLVPQSKLDSSPLSQVVYSTNK